MMISKRSEEEKQKKPTTPMPPERSKPLHNFTLPGVKWGNSQLLRCVKKPNGEASSSDRRSPASDSESDGEIKDKQRSPNGAGRVVRTPSPSEGDDGIEQVKEKLMLHYKSAVDKMKVLTVQEEESASTPPEKPWNLRTRRAAACKEVGEERKHKSSPSRRNPSPKSLRLRGLAAQSGEKERKKFSASLSREEIEEDFFVMTSAKPSRRPKRRPRTLQKQLDTLYPGLWLSEITADTYKVPDGQK